MSLSETNLCPLSLDYEINFDKKAEKQTVEFRQGGKIPTLIRTRIMT